jgi:hypothetical protein
MKPTFELNLAEKFFCFVYGTLIAGAIIYGSVFICVWALR